MSVSQWASTGTVSFFTNKEDIISSRDRRMHAFHLARAPGWNGRLFIYPEIGSAAWVGNWCRHVSKSRVSTVFHIKGPSSIRFFARLVSNLFSENSNLPSIHYDNNLTTMSVKFKELAFDEY